MHTSFEIPGKVKPKERPRLAKRGRHSFIYTPKTTLDYEAHVARSAVFPEGWPKDGSYELSVVIFEVNNVYGDLDNCAKSIKDGLNGVAWDDDKQVCQLTVRRTFGEVAHAVVQIRAVPRQSAPKKLRSKKTVGTIDS